MFILDFRTSPRCSGTLPVIEADALARATPLASWTDSISLHPPAQSFAPFAKWDLPVPARDVTNIRPERIDAPEAKERNTVFAIIAGIFMIALVIGYAGYCFYATAEKINQTSEKFGIELPRRLSPETAPATTAPSKWYASWSFADATERRGLLADQACRAK
jgi:hypothetical protein